MFRFEGREFAALLTNITLSVDAADVAEKIVKQTSVPYTFRGSNIFVSCLVGITLYPDDGQKRDQLIQNASSALREARKTHQPFRFFNRELHDQAKHRMELELGLRSAFGKRELHLFYQPIVDTEGQIQGCEALIRWNRSKEGWISPAEFIPLAEETGLIRLVGKWVLYQACEQAKRWSIDSDLYVSVNISGTEFESEDLIEVVAGALRSADELDPKHLKVEITETIGMVNPEQGIKKMLELQTIGVDTVIDDFGKGYSSLSYLGNLPATMLKIDRDFVVKIAEDRDERTFLDGIVRLVKSRKKLVVVEGVDSPQQVELLRAMGCDRIQGYYFSKPVTAEELTGYINRNETLPLGS